MSNPNDPEAVEIDHHVSMGEALNRLRKNPDFELVIMTGYLKEKALASVSLLSSPQLKEQGKRGDIMEDLIAGSNLQYFFQMIDQFYEGAKNPILSDQEQAEFDAMNESQVVN